MKFNRFWTATAVAGLLISGLIFTGPATAAETTIKIGNIIPLSGPSASVGQQGKIEPRKRKYQHACNHYNQYGPEANIWLNFSCFMRTQMDVGNGLKRWRNQTGVVLIHIVFYKDFQVCFHLFRIHRRIKFHIGPGRTFIFNRIFEGCQRGNPEMGILRKVFYHSVHCIAYRINSKLMNQINACSEGIFRRHFQSIPQC